MRGGRLARTSSIRQKWKENQSPITPQSEESRPQSPHACDPHPHPPPPICSPRPVCITSHSWSPHAVCIAWKQAQALPHVKFFHPHVVIILRMHVSSCDVRMCMHIKMKTNLCARMSSAPTTSMALHGIELHVGARLCMFHVFQMYVSYMDVVACVLSGCCKIWSGVAYVAMAIHVCFKCMFRMFQLFHTYIANVFI